MRVVHGASSVTGVGEFQPSVWRRVRARLDLSVPLARTLSKLVSAIQEKEKEKETMIRETTDARRSRSDDPT